MKPITALPHIAHLFVAFLSVIQIEQAPADDAKRDQIGEVLGKPVYRDELKKEGSPANELHRLFTQPVMAKYRKEHEKEITPTEGELAAAQKVFDDKHLERIKDNLDSLKTELKEVEEKLKEENLPTDERRKLDLRKANLTAKIGPPGRRFAEFMLNNWKFQRHLYDKFGGGRILWQQAGIEAFDATRKWLETQEKEGAFKISDPALRKEFYHYWTTQNHGAFLTNDKERIRTEFLEVEWAPRQSMK